VPRSCLPALCGPLASLRVSGRCELSLYYVLTRLRKSRLGLNTEPPCIVKKFVHTLVINLSVQEFADAWSVGL